MKNYKELEIILSDYTCDKNCPYCTAKITRWNKETDAINLLELNVGQLKKLGYAFHYVTLGGNGEPTLHSINKLRDIVEMFDDYDIPIKRVLSSGNIFRPENKEKYDLFVTHNWMIEVTTTSFDNDVDREVLGYNHNYFETDAFKHARIRLNYVLLKSNIDKCIDDIKSFAQKYNNIETLALKLLNVNTKTGVADNPISEWIVKHGIPKENRNEIANMLSDNFEYIGEGYDTHSWRMTDGKEVYFSWKKLKYGLYDLVWYGDRFVTYQLEDVNLNLLDKIYIASKFVKENDFREILIGNKSDFNNFNNHSFITGKNGNLKYQYIGPFYNEKASNGELTSSICDEVVAAENELVRNCDIFAVYLDENYSPGSITELTYAAILNKKIIIFYKKESNIKYEMKSTNWYPIINAKKFADNVEIIAVNDQEEIIDYLRN